MGPSMLEEEEDVEVTRGPVVTLRIDGGKLKKETKIKLDLRNAQRQREKRHSCSGINQLSFPAWHCLVLHSCL